MLSDRCRCLSVLSVCLPVCNHGVLWLNGWMIRMPLGMEVGLSQGHIVLQPSPPFKKGAQLPPPKKKIGPCLLWTNGWMNQDATWYNIVLHWDPAPLQKGGGHSSPHFSTHVCCGQTPGWIKIPFGTDVRLGPVHIVFDRVPASLQKGHSSPQFSAHVYYGAKRLDGSRCHLVCR